MIFCVVSFDGKKIAQGRDQALTYLKANPDAQVKIYEKIKCEVHFPSVSIINGSSLVNRNVKNFLFYFSNSLYI